MEDEDATSERRTTVDHRQGSSALMRKKTLKQKASGANYLLLGCSVRQAVSEPSLDKNSEKQNSENIAGVWWRVDNADSSHVDEGWPEEVTAQEPSFASADSLESLVDSGYSGSSGIVEN
ncbi:unnamed protein product [Angiostrongylus costaricensis]|uniref:Uncharacterized protein n=1 Tax=Angiostrongylus costaricensis TaxID=334426 RepID=A0A0R3Q243_ANGCS|nr:unnamed protein product [Angiostrongylus costaricensis]